MTLKVVQTCDEHYTKSWELLVGEALEGEVDWWETAIGGTEIVPKLYNAMAMAWTPDGRIRHLTSVGSFPTLEEAVAAVKHALESQQRPLFFGSEP